MIKKSLQDLRAKLDVLKKDKEVVETGVAEYEHKNNLIYRWDSELNNNYKLTIWTPICSSSEGPHASKEPM